MTRCRMHDQKPDPTPEEIRRACLEIQAGWTEAEERKRRAVPSLSPDVPEVRTVGLTAWQAAGNADGP